MRLDWTSKLTFCLSSSISEQLEEVKGNSMRGRKAELLGMMNYYHDAGFYWIVIVICCFFYMK